MDEPQYESFKSLFPMRMTSIEKFHWFDDNPDYPNLIFCRLKIDGSIDETLARKAWQIAVQRQPFGDVRPQRKRGKYVWVSGPRGDSESNSDFETWQGTRFSFEKLEAEQPWAYADHQLESPTGSFIGIRTWPTDMNRAATELDFSNEQKAPSKFTSDVWLYVHHAIGDGVGSILVINEWLVIYSNLQSGRSPGHGLHRLDPALLKTRNSVGFWTWRYLKHLYKQPIALFGAAKFVFRKTAKLLPNSDKTTGTRSRSSEGCFPAMIGQWIDESKTNRIATHARQNEVMVNSVLLGQLYFALADWRERNGGHSETDWMRVVLPMSIRNVSDRRLPTANRAAIVQIDRCGKDMKVQRAFYQGLNREILIIRGWHLEKMFLLAIRAMSISNWLLKRNAENDKSRGMVVFTNLGEPLRKSERAARISSSSDDAPSCVTPLRPVEFDLVGPVRMGTPVNFTASRYGARLRISMHYDHRLLSGAEAEGLLQTYVERLVSVS